MGEGDPIAKFMSDREDSVALLGTDPTVRRATTEWMRAANALRYSYNFNAFGRPIIQYPQDMVAIQELVWQIRPTLIIETGIAHGGSLIMSAALLALLDYADATVDDDFAGIARSKRRVIGIDVDIRSHNRVAIDAHPFRRKISMISGSSIATEVIANVEEQISADDIVLVLLDSNHSHNHVLAELHAYAPLVTKGSYCVVFDTIIEDLDPDSFPNRPWDVGNNPKTAVREFLSLLSESPIPARDGKPLAFEIDRQIDHRLQISVAPEGFLRRMPV